MKKVLTVFSFLSLILIGCTNDCADVNCLNNGECNEGACVCPEGYEGQYCENEVDPCDNVDCFNGGVCVDGTCDCPPGYEGVDCGTMVDPCVDVDCGANGVCVEGDCICDAGYEGDNCEIESRAKFIGIWIVNETCASSTDNYNLTISVNANGVDRVSIFNLYGAGEMLVGVVSGSSITIASQTSPNQYTYSGSGTISNNTLTISYTIADNMGNSDSCTLTATM